MKKIKLSTVAVIPDAPGIKSVVVGEGGIRRTEQRLIAKTYRLLNPTATGIKITTPMFLSDIILFRITTIGHTASIPNYILVTYQISGVAKTLVDNAHKRSQMNAGQNDVSILPVGDNIEINIKTTPYTGIYVEKIRMNPTDGLISNFTFSDY